MSLKSIQGVILDRAERLGTDSEGKAIKKRSTNHGDVKCDNCGTRRRDCVGKCCDDCWHPHAVTVKETRSHALSHPGLDDGIDERLLREGQLRRGFDDLDREERAVLFLHERVDGQRVVKQNALPSELDDLYAAGWVKTGKRHGSRVEVVKSFPRKLSYEQIGDLLGLTVEAVRWRVVRAHRKLRDAVGAR